MLHCAFFSVVVLFSNQTESMFKNRLNKTFRGNSKSQSMSLDHNEDHANVQLHKNDPSIQFEVSPLVSGKASKAHQLVLSAKNVAVMKGNSVVNQWNSEDIVSVKCDRNKFDVQVLVHFEFQAEDSDQVLRVRDACKALGIGGKVVGLEDKDTRKAEIEQVQVQAQDEDSLGLNESKSGLITAVNTAPPSNSHSKPVQNEEKSESVGKQEVKKYCLDDFEVLKVVGEGSFGKVMKVKRKEDKQVLAMKMLKIENYPGDPFAEQKILENLNHPFIVKLFCSFQENGYLYLCMDYAEHGDLFFHLRKLERFSEEIACFYLAEIILALDYLHRNQIVYRDLKPENILLDADGHIKIGDLGLAKSGITSMGGVDSEGIKAQTFCGTPQYLAPEILKGVEHGFAVDWWSAGIVLYEMLTGSVPFYSDNRNEMYLQAIKGEIDFPSYVSKDASKLIKGVLVRRPEDRLGSGSLGVFELRKHAFFKSINWKLLETRSLNSPYRPEISHDTPAFAYGLSTINSRIKSSRGKNASALAEEPKSTQATEKAYVSSTENKNFHNSDSVASEEHESLSGNALESLIRSMEKKVVSSSK
jgi:serine/threonine protein kinase